MLRSPSLSPPWNQYDLNTLKALEDLAFTTLSAGKEGAANPDSSLRFLPYTSTLYQLKGTIEEAKRSSDPQPVIVVLFHEYDFQEIDEKQGIITLSEFSDLLNELKVQGNIRMMSIRQATELISDLSVHRFLLGRRIISLSNLLPSLLLKEQGRRYVSIEDFKALRLRMILFYLTLFTLAFCASLVLGIILFPKSRWITHLGLYGSMALFVILLLYVFSDPGFI